MRSCILPIAVPRAAALVALLAVAIGIAGGLGLPPGAGPTSAVEGMTSTPRPSPTRAPRVVPRPSPTSTAAPTATPPPSATPTPGATPVPTATPTPAGPFEMNLYETGDFVSEVTKVMCVPAAMQTMMNIMSPGADRSARLQRDLYALARRLSTYRLVGAGAEPEGWARGLDRRGFGPYVVDVQATRGRAIKAAARAIRETGRPAGLLVWRGAHSWVMSGFRATADPAVTDDFRVTHVHIQDVWYPRVSSIWGASRRPNALVQVEQLREDYLQWRRPTVRYPEKDGRFVLVLPALADDSG